MLWFLSSSIRFLTSNDEEEDKGDHFRFGSVFIKKNNQTEIIFFLKKNRNRTETGSNRPVSVRFDFLGQKPVQTGLARFFRFWLVFLGFGSVFSGFGSVFSVWLGFDSVWLDFFPVFCRVRFGFFLFFAYKTETEPNRPVFSKI